MKNFHLTMIAPKVERVFAKASSGAVGNVFKGMATLAIGSSVAKLIGIASIPILTRIYSPEDFGVLSVFTALVMMLYPVVTMRYVLAIPLPRYNGIAFNILFLSVVIMVGNTAIISLLLWMFGDQVLPFFSMATLSSWWWLISLGILAAATFEILTLWATRERDYRIIAKTNIWQSVVSTAAKISLGLVLINSGGLLIGQVASYGVGVGSIFRRFQGSFNNNWRQLSFSRIQKVAWRYLEFPIFRVPSQFLMVFATQSPLLFMAALYDASATGQLSLALTAIGIPIQLFGHTVAKSFYAEAASLGNKKPHEIRKMANSVVVRLAFFSIPPALFLFFSAPYLFELFFGEKWELAGEYTSILAIYLVFQFVQAPAAYIFYIFDGQKQLLYLSAQRALLLMACFGFSYVMGLAAEETIWMYSLVLSAHYILSIYYSLRFIPN
ncbi:oligosaccharide flippase family protein [Halomonas sp. CS7]|uniref:Oligosaccharide flippase family protein n=1 Tax=Halomonas pelophila TaxID=3151122 RepID=A0ABV1N566_9GAMM